MLTRILYPENVAVSIITKLAIVVCQVLLGIMCFSSPWYITTSFFLCFVIGILLFIRLEWIIFLIILNVFLFENLVGFHIPERQTSIRNIIPIYGPFVYLTLAFFLIKRVTKSTSEIVQNELFLPVFFLICYALLSHFWGPPIGYSLPAYNYMLLNFLLLYFVVQSLNNETYHRQIMWFIIILGNVLAIQIFLNKYLDSSINYAINISEGADFIISYAPGISLDKSDTYRGQASFSANHTGFLLNMIISVTIGFLLGEKSRWRGKILGMVLALFIFCVLLTKSRTAAASLVLMIMFIIVIKFRLRKIILYMVFTSIGLMLLLFLTLHFSPETKGIRLFDASDKTITEVSSKSDSFRLQIWKEGFKEVKKKSCMLWGLGVDGFSYYTGISHCHNSYLGYYFDYGVAGLVFIISIVYVLAKNFLKIAKYQETYLQNMSLAMGGGLVSMAASCLLAHRYLNSNQWFFIALSYATFSLAKRELEQMF